MLYILILAVSNNESTTDWYEKGGKIGVKGGKQDLLIKYKPVRVDMHTARLNKKACGMGLHVAVGTSSFRLKSTGGFKFEQEFLVHFEKVVKTNLVF